MMFFAIILTNNIPVDSNGVSLEHWQDNAREVYSSQFFSEISHSSAEQDRVWNKEKYNEISHNNCAQ